MKEIEVISEFIQDLKEFINEGEEEIVEFYRREDKKENNKINNVIYVDFQARKKVE